MSIERKRNVGHPKAAKKARRKSQPKVKHTLADLVMAGIKVSRCEQVDHESKRYRAFRGPYGSGRTDNLFFVTVGGAVRFGPTPSTAKVSEVWHNIFKQRGERYYANQQYCDELLGRLEDARDILGDPDAHPEDYNSAAHERNVAIRQLNHIAMHGVPDHGFRDRW